MPEDGPLWTVSRAERGAVQLKRYHAATWRDRGDLYWWWRLLQEFVELTLALLGWHEHDPAYELYQIASIAMNWLERIHKRSAP